MDEIITFFSNYGLVITLIALAGIIILGVLKYCNVFKNLDEDKRHYLYLIISVGLSIIGTIIYLLIIGQFEMKYILSVAAAMWALNQTFYNIFKITPIKDLAIKVLDWIVEKIKKKTD